MSSTIKEKPKATRDGFGEGLRILGETNPRIVVLTADLTESTRAGPFKDRFPERFFQFGVAEQNMMCAAAGFSLTGFIPYVCTYGVFSAGRCWDQIRVSIAYSDCNVKIEGAHSGLMVGPDGYTHQALEDIATTRVIPNMKVIVPADAIEARKATIKAAEIPGPVYIRVGRIATPYVTSEETPFVFSKANVLREGKDVTVVACGVEVHESIVAAEEAKKAGIDVGVVNLHTIKPLDEETIIKFAKSTGAIVTAEEHQINGGLGGAVAEVLARNYPTPIEMVAVRDSFGMSGEPWELMDKFGLTHNGILQAIKTVLKRK
jgi:transketolase